MSTSTVMPLEPSSQLSHVRRNSGLVDVALALCWIPFAAAGWMFRNDPDSTVWLVSVTLLGLAVALVVSLEGFLSQPASMKAPVSRTNISTVNDEGYRVLVFMRVLTYGPSCRVWVYCYLA